MKSFFQICLSLSLMCIIIPSCQHKNTEELEKAKQFLQFHAATENKQLEESKEILQPMGINSIHEEFDGTNYITTTEMNEDLVPIEILQNQKEKLKDELKVKLNSSELQELKENLIVTGGKFIAHYVGNRSKEKVTITIEP